MSSYLALAVSVGVLAVVATWLFFFEPVAAANLQVWKAFIAWGCHYHAGGKITGTRNTIVCMSFGAVVGMAAGMLAHAPRRRSASSRHRSPSASARRSSAWHRRCRSSP